MRPREGKGLAQDTKLAVVRVKSDPRSLPSTRGCASVLALWPARPGVQAGHSGWQAYEVNGEQAAEPSSTTAITKAQTGHLCFDQKEIGHRERKSTQRHAGPQPSASPQLQPISAFLGDTGRKTEEL